MRRNHTVPNGVLPVAGIANAELKRIVMLLNENISSLRSAVDDCKQRVSTLTVSQPKTRTVEIRSSSGGEMDDEYAITREYSIGYSINSSVSINIYSNSIEVDGYSPVGIVQHDSEISHVIASGCNLIEQDGIMVAHFRIKNTSTSQQVHNMNFTVLYIRNPANTEN